ncbi:MAG: radical SAM protein, partial [Myxococcales bacterium]|nr:radical SAM protein [Myxococcales bacterium]
PRLMPHLHLSVQAGDDTVLRRMKRRHLRADVVGVAARARSARPDVVFGADLIAGFPTESDAMFERTLALVDECDLVHLHVFPYSERPGTPAAKMPAVPVPVRKQRAARLREAGSRRLERFLNAQVGREVDVLMESATSGRTPDFAFVAVTEGAEPGAIVRRRILGVSDGRLLA